MDHKKASLLEHEEVAKFLETDLKRGLSQAEAHRRLQRFGLNKLDGKEATAASSTTGKWRQLAERLRTSQACQFLCQLTSPLIQLLLICALVSGLIGQWENAISVLVAVLLVCTISYLQERRADRSLEKLSRRVPSSCQVIRNNQLLELESELLVPGDLVLLREGQRVPADIRLFELHSLTINESNLTGETQSQWKQTSSYFKHPFDPNSTITSSANGSLSNISTSAASQQHQDESSAAGAHQHQDPVAKKLAGPLMALEVDAGELLHERRLVNQNLALMGTLVESGHSRGLVFATGRWTRYGEVFNMLKSAQRPRSPLQANIDQLSVHLVVLACCIIAGLAILAIVQQRAPLEVAFYAISLAVTAIPEGLPVVVAVIMALGVLKLSRQRTIVKSLTSIETLGCIQILCLDKTGTLTRNDMTLTDIVTSELHSLSRDQLDELARDACVRQLTFSKFGDKLYSLGRLMEVATLCNNAAVAATDAGHSEANDELASDNQGPRVTHPDDSESVANSSSCSSNQTETGKRRLVGQATECAILEAAIRLGFGDSRAKFERLSEQPFSATTRCMIVQCRRRDQNKVPAHFYIKGAWEEVLHICSHYYDSGLVRSRTEPMWHEYERLATRLGSRGLRVLALATGASLEQLTFVGLLGISNALRDGMVETVAKLRDKFHIDVKMITGDSQPTAVAVGRSLGLLGADSLEQQDKRIMSGDELQRLLSTDLEQTVKAREIMARNVFYRVDPIQKASIIGKLQDLGQVVGMTGDGVNDVISLKRANLSLAMGSGADVCKEIADVVMVDDDLSVLLEAVLEGKAIYHKIHSFLAYQISISFTLVLLTAIAFGAQTDPPFSVTQLLYINILADGPPAQSLGLEQLSENELSMWPRNVKDSLLSCRLLATLTVLSSTLLALNGGLYYYLLDPSGHLGEQSRALLFACFVCCAAFAALSLRSKFKTIVESRPQGNKELLVCCALVLLLQLTLTQVPWLSDLFNMAPVSYVELLYVFLYAAIVLIIMDGLKLFVRSLEHGQRLFIKAVHNLPMPSRAGRKQTYHTSTTAMATKTGKPSGRQQLVSNSRYLATMRPDTGTRCLAITPLAAPRTLFGNIMATPTINTSTTNPTSNSEKTEANNF